LVFNLEDEMHDRQVPMKYKNHLNMLVALLIAALIPLWGCAKHAGQDLAGTQLKPEAASQTSLSGQTNTSAESAVDSVVSATAPSTPKGAEQGPVAPDSTFRPQVTWKPSYSLEDISLEKDEDQKPRLRVGANMIARDGKVALRDAVKGLADLKGMNVSWTSDVDQEALVDVIIKADDDFWTALSNVLRQLDYFYEFKDNTIIVKYKETRRFYIPMPYLTAAYKTSVGGDLLGAKETTEGRLRGQLSVEHVDENIDLWETIEKNLEKMLQLATTQVPVAKGALSAADDARIKALCYEQFPSRPAQQALCIQRAAADAELGTIGQPPTGVAAPVAGVQTQGKAGDREGYFYTIDKPLGIVTVTAPRSMLEQVSAYLDAVKQELSRQVVIEAKILEVELNRTSQKGIDWSQLLKNSRFGFDVVFGDNGQIYPSEGIKLISQVNLATKSFDLFLNFLNEYGNVKVLSNPKLSLLNGQPAMLTVGTSESYVDSVNSTIDSETGIITYTVNTSSILSGLGFGVMANFSSNDEIVLHLTPVTSQLVGITYEGFGSQGSESRVGLPTVFLRELTTMARVKNGQLLIIGGLIDERNSTDESKVPLLGDIPVLGTAFKNIKEVTQKRELIILLRPEIVTI
jgi:MSHA type pilus biogenesis protein MshL